MNLLDSKVMKTEYEQEIYIDEVSNFNLINFLVPEKGRNFYECLIGVKLLRLRDDQFYGSKRSYFGIRISADLQSIEIFEPDIQSIFAAKNELERTEAKELMEYILTESNAFKQKLINEKAAAKNENTAQEEDIKRFKGVQAFLERLGNVQQEEIHNALKEKAIA